jgi:hypothetical protein
MVDNFELIKSLLEFRSSDDFYFLQIIQRKKDNKVDGVQTIEGSSNNSRMIKMYTVHSKEYLDKMKSEIIELCKLFNARAGIDLNRKSYQQCSLQTARLIMDQFLNKNYSDTVKAYSSVCGRFSNESEKKWIVDIDADELIWKPQIIDAIQPCLPEGNKILAEIPTKSGLHLITKPFNSAQFQVNLVKELEEYAADPIKVDIHKMNPTILYTP